MNKLIKILVKIITGGNDFKNLFLYNEFNDLTGKGRKGILALAVILALTFSALGYSIGGIKYLKAKMDDPFTNWVNMIVKPSYKDKIPTLINHFDKQSNRDSFYLDNISEYIIEYFYFSDPTKQGIFNKKVRSIDPTEKLLKEILHEKNGNVVAGYEYKDGEELDFPDCAIILKESALVNTLGYTDVETLERVPFFRGNFLIYPEVFAIVKELPDLCEALVSNHYYNILQKEFGRTGFISVNSSNKFAIHGNIVPGKEESFEDKARSILQEYDLLSSEVSKFKLSESLSLDVFEGYSKDYYAVDSIRKIADLFVENKLMTNANIYIPSNCEVGETFSEINDPYYLAFNFNKLDRVRDFNEYIKNNPRYNMEITMDQVESKENFALVSRLTGLIAIILLIFSLLSIVFYINSLLTKHLEKIKKNLGTLKAFGLNNRFLISTYIGIILLFMVFSIVIAFAISLGISYIEQATSKIAIIDLFNYKILLTILLILVFTVITSYNSIKKILLKTPGDLIYNR